MWNSGACSARHLPSAEGSESTTDVGLPTPDVSLFPLDLDTPEILRALEDFSEQILCNDTKFEFEQSFNNEAVASSSAVECGTSTPNKVETTGLEEFFTQPEFLFNLSHVHTLDSLYVGQPAPAPINAAELKVLTPPVSPNMYYAEEKPVINFMSTDEKMVDVGGVKDAVSDNYDNWFSSGTIRSDDLFPDLAI